MKLKDQVVSLELAKKMKELGFPQKSLCYWERHKIYNKKKKEEWFIEVDGYSYDRGECEEKVSAYTVGELGEMLPASIEKNNNLYLIEERKSPKDNNNFYIGYHSISCTTNNSECLHKVNFNDIKESDVRAKILIYLKKNNLIS